MSKNPQNRKRVNAQNTKKVKKMLEKYEYNEEEAIEKNIALALFGIANELHDASGRLSKIENILSTSSDLLINFKLEEIFDALGSISTSIDRATDVNR